MKRLTNSEVKAWKRDRRVWWLGTYRGLIKREVTFNRPLSIGNRVHGALAAYYDPAGDVDPVAWIENSVAEDIFAYPAHEIDITKESQLATIMMKGYVQWCEETGADVGMELLQSEGASEVELIPGVLSLLTKMDAQVRTPDGLRLNLEHKTVGNLSVALPTLQMDSQCLTEHLVEYLLLEREGRTSDRADGVLYNMLRKVKRTAAAKPPFYGRVPVRHNINELRSHWTHTMAIGIEILEATAALDAGGDHHVICPPNVTRDSNWDNPFHDIFPMFDDGSDAEAAIADLYVTRDPLERYAGLITEED